MCERYWQWGNVRLWLRRRTRCERGEPQARLVFSKALGWDPEALPLGRDVRGRPRFAGPLSVWDISWSHSGDYLLLALGYGGCLGVDLERERFRPHLLDLAQRFFHPNETAVLGTLDEPARQALFFRLWCAKEAILKAHGAGIAFGLHRLHLAEDEGHLMLVECDAALGAAMAWRIYEWQAAPGYRAALAWRPFATIE
ncbi:4'-phosphopantetheinyl transferase superfamily protein [Xylella fastidiosa subsp. morus]|uniref:4'-phosphopantetheinyl transferase family protein n=1 Tax=Xylella fastidiosa TaxID=2371 RepID=UPI0003ECE67F|nr:4'-phosphopantetheinyl transferase superfamily protein [Xylella fastidiosa]AIC12405.1 4-phosphopantetheinyl transferase [Xylella fastidiosa MUL0034]EWG14289.1 4'-phosphopantetheinyl transferase [Xylella fastidiosa Mul-MD]UIN27708.1 4'-phosphopantetheinyl transferase superfamily protein [Xylella fastidiosa subsp. morus]UIT35765.1 4'-phosphopantetheinyl transferase superfamily protein [Xylella fastidiosa subsp. morus]UIT38057.1 4'-phosphopantetheinyl transferase superfamily protein [Xylella f